MILQRIGTPPQGLGSGAYHVFGLALGDPTIPWTNVHNVHFTSSTKTSKLKGKETLTLFVNTVTDSDVAHVFEFELDLEDSGFTNAKTTDYVSVACSFTTPVFGGARPIADGIYAVVSGVTAGVKGTFVELVDLSGAVVDYFYPGVDVDAGDKPPALYDPFMYVVKK